MLLPIAIPLSATMVSVGRRSLPTTTTSVTAKRGLVITCCRVAQATPMDEATTRTIPAAVRRPDKKREGRGAPATSTTGEDSTRGGATRRFAGVIAKAPAKGSQGARGRWH